MLPATVVTDAPEKVFRVLQVEDDAGYARLIELLLRQFERYRFDLVHVPTLTEALEQIHEQPFDIVLLDLSLPDSRGLATLERMYQMAPELPIVLLTCTKNDTTSLQAVQCGAQDYLVKGEFNADLLMRVIWYAIDRKRAERDLAHLAQYDPLTGLANRQLFIDRLEQAILRARRSRSLLGLLYLDVDGFKAINDEQGHDIGDQLLQRLAIRVQGCVRAEDTVARLGGDEFTVIVENVSDKAALEGIAAKIVDSISEGFRLRGRALFTAVSIGATLYDGGRVLDVKRLIKQADMAMYRAKRRAGSHMVFFTDEMDRASRARGRIENALRDALSTEQFELEYQPQVDVVTGRLAGAEALLRWRNSEFGHAPVSDFIAILEQIGAIGSVGEWVLGTACRQWRLWCESGEVDPHSTVSVNFSARQFWQYDVVRLVDTVLGQTGLAAHQLDVELTETALLRNTERNVSTLEALRSRGVSVTIDDFGTGFGSLSYLKYFPIDRLKIDRSFVQDILDNEQDVAIASAIIDLARNLGLSVIAEGVDTWDKARLLYERGCGIFQGFYFSRPLPAASFLRHCRNRQVQGIRTIHPPSRSGD